MILGTSKDPHKKNRSLIKVKGTGIEMWLRLRLHARGFRYRVNVKKLPGKPDIVLSKYKCVIFVNGCFWHLHNCHFFQWPKKNQDWWRVKISTNRKRDLVVQDKLRELGWRVMIVWKCAIQGKTKLDEEFLLDLVSSWIKNGGPLLEITGKEPV